jgi:hypothetical protein
LGGGRGGDHGIFCFQVNLKHDNAQGRGRYFKGKKTRQVATIQKIGAAKVTPAANEFNAYYLAMVEANPASRGNVGGVPVSTHYALPNPPVVGNPTLFITSKLSGCHFAVGSNAAGTRLVSHIEGDPALALVDNATNTTPRANDQMAVVSGGMTNVAAHYRKRDEYTETAAVVGRYRKGGWRFYGQGQNYNEKGRVIEEVARIF